jgi:hypothetical protein
MSDCWTAQGAPHAPRCPNTPQGEQMLSTVEIQSLLAQLRARERPKGEVLEGASKPVYSDGVLYNTTTPSATPTHAPDPERIASHACGCIEQGRPEPDCPKRGLSECPSPYLTSRETWYIKK